LNDDTGQEKTEQATQKRREETRNRGNVARSTEVNSAVILLAGFSAMLLFRNHFMNTMERSSAHFFARGHTYQLTVQTVQQLFLSEILDFMYILYPFLIALFVAGIVVNILQVGFLFTAEPITPKFEKINPIEGFKRIFSKKSVESIIRDILKIIIVGWIGYTALRDIMNEVMGVADSSVQQIFAFTGTAIFNISMKILIGYVIIAVLDYGFQRWDYEQSMKMTRQEVREELKQTEGDPLLRARIRSVQREMARRRMMAEVPKADVVVTNPTEIAVALSYSTEMAAPVVVAKGRHLIAEKIRSIAVEAGVPIVENVALAQALFKAVEIGRVIPGELYTAVAEVLAYVYRLKGKKVV
jgi:flagellar biosynthesis protein FlhB